MRVKALQSGIKKIPRGFCYIGNRNRLVDSYVKYVKKKIIRKPVVCILNLLLRNVVKWSDPLQKSSYSMLQGF